MLPSVGYIQLHVCTILVDFFPRLKPKLRLILSAQIRTTLARSPSQKIAPPPRNLWLYRTWSTVDSLRPASAIRGQLFVYWLLIENDLEAYIKALPIFITDIGAASRGRIMLCRLRNTSSVSLTSSPTIASTLVPTWNSTWNWQRDINHALMEYPLDQLRRNIELNQALGYLYRCQRWWDSNSRLDWLSSTNNAEQELPFELEGRRAIRSLV